MIWMPGPGANLQGAGAVGDALLLPGTSVGDELRRVIEARRWRVRRLRLSALIACAAIPIATTIFWKAPVLLVWNASASAPPGLYVVRPGAEIRRGDMLVAWTPGRLRPLAASRHYLPVNVPLVKRVAAVGGDRVCASGRAVRINGRRAVTRLRHDPAGRAMPWWSGCKQLSSGQYLLLTDSPLSFDGRYFGLTAKADLVGRARLLWADPARGHSDG